MDIPFIYGRLAEKESFIDRVEDRRELKNFLRHGINVILVSARRWGKSSLVRTSMEELMQEESKTKVCFMDASKIHTEEEFYNKFASIVIQGVSSTLEQKLSDLVKFINRFTPSITIASDPMNSVEVNLKVNPMKESPENILQLPERIAEAKGIKIIVCIDEFQQLANLPKWKNLEAMLRAEWQLQHHTTYCLYGSKMHMMKDIFNKTNSPFFKFGQLMNLKRIAKEYWIPYIMSNFKKTGKSISESQAECLCERVKYNSWYVQLLPMVAYRQRGKSRTPRQPAPTGFGHQRRPVLNRDGRAHSHPNRHAESHCFWRKALQCQGCRREVWSGAATEHHKK